MLAVMDNTLEELGTRMDCRKLKRRIVWLVLGWSVTALLLNYNDYIRWRDVTHNDLTSICLAFMFNYCTHISIIDDFIFASILQYIGLKLDQVNEHLHRLAKENIRGIKRAWERPVTISQQLSIPSSKRTVWIMIHLHLELRKISRQINSIFQVQMTVKMVTYFSFIAEFFRELFTAIFIRNYAIDKRILFIIIIICWLAWYICRLFLINYICDRISTKEKATRSFVSKISYFTCDIEIRENILQFLLQITQTPIRFCGLGLFQFGFRYLYKYFEYILSLIIILIQTDKFTSSS